MSWKMLAGLNRHLPKNTLGDYLYSAALFYKCHGRLPSKHKGFNDRLFHIKTGRSIQNPLRGFVSDKEFVKLFVTATIGEQFTVPSLKVLRTAEETKAYVFPDRCCIKPTHMSGEVILRTDGEPVSMEKILGWFDASYYVQSREANYRYLKPKVVVEPLIFDSTDINEYKIFCNRGVPRLVQVDEHRFIGHRRTYYDPNWVEQSFRFGQPPRGGGVPKPKNLAAMLKAASALSQHFDFIRVDLYSDGNSVLVGELTNCPCSCTSKFQPLDAEETMARMVFGEVSGEFVAPEAAPAVAAKSASETATIARPLVCR